MAADSRDDFSGFTGVEHMLFGVADPFVRLRAEIEAGVGEQRAGARVEGIRCTEMPKFLTLGRRREDEPDKIIVTYFAGCFRCALTLAGDEAPTFATLTLCFGEVDRPGHERTRRFLELHEDDASVIDEADFQARFLEFRNDASS